jgi:hypothetical protein
LVQIREAVELSRSIDPEEYKLKTAFFAGLEVDLPENQKTSYLTGVLDHPGQKFLHFTDWQYITLMWGRRTGKTIAAAAEIVWTLSKENKKVWIVAPNYELTDRVFEYVYKWIVLDECFGKDSVVRSAKTKDNRYIELRWNSVVRGKSGEAPSSLIGDQLDLIVMDEAARCPEIIWVESLEPCTIDRRGKVIFISTPRGRNWFFRYFERGLDEALQKKGWRSLKLSTRQNPFVDKKWLDAKEAETPPHVWRREYEASPEEYSGLVFPRFRAYDKSRGGHLYDPRIEGPPDGSTVYGGIDIGWRHPTGGCLLKTDQQNNLWIFSEYKEQGLSHDDHSKNLRARYPYPVYMWLMSPDATREQGLRRDERGESAQDVYRQNGIMARPAFDRVREGCDIINRYLEATLAGEHSDHPKLYISKDCTSLIADLQEYIFEEHNERLDKAPAEKPRKKNDDLIDAFRYVVAHQPRFVKSWSDKMEPTYAGPHRYGHQDSHMYKKAQRKKKLGPQSVPRQQTRVIGRR